MTMSWPSSGCWLWPPKPIHPPVMTWWKDRKGLVMVPVFWNSKWKEKESFCKWCGSNFLWECVFKNIILFICVIIYNHIYLYQLSTTSKFTNQNSTLAHSGVVPKITNKNIMTGVFPFSSTQNASAQAPSLAIAGKGIRFSTKNHQCS